MSPVSFSRRAALALFLLAAAAPAQRPNPIFAPVEDLPGLPRVLLIGDSISMGYTLGVRELLAGRANVHRIPENGGPTSRGIEKLDTWLGDGEWDLIHFNWGLHDLKRMPGGERQVELEAYAHNLDALTARLGKTGARLIWAPTTPVPPGDVEPPRSSEDVIAYNAAAGEVMARREVEIDDLYALVVDRLEELQQPVNVHFKPVGSKVLAEQVARAVRAALPPPEGDDRRARPNVLFIAIDDLNDWVGVLGGHPQARTPNLDRLARRGVLFTDAHCAAPVCNPSRAAVMTGVPPHRSGVYQNTQPWRPALKDAVTIPQHFGANGYTALGAGKIFHGSFPDPPSWDRYFPSKKKQRPDDPVPEGRPLNGIPRAANFDWGPLDVDTDAMGDAQVAKWVGAELSRRHEQPFFLACGLYRPHLPWYVPRGYLAAPELAEDDILLPEVLDGDVDDLPATGLRFAHRNNDHARIVEHGKWRAAVRAYLAAIAFSDDMLGRVLDALERGPNAENTIVVLWSDHGWHLGEKEHWRKFTLWNESTRVPLIVVAPRGTPGLPAGTPQAARCARTVSLLDLYPTLSELCGLPARDGLGGESLVPLLRDQNAPRARPALTTFGRGNHAVCTERWRYIRYADGGQELYDRAADPNEWHNLASQAEHAATIAELARFLPAEDAKAAAPRRRGR